MGRDSCFRPHAVCINPICDRGAVPIFWILSQSGEYISAETKFRSSLCLPRPRILHAMRPGPNVPRICSDSFPSPRPTTREAYGRGTRERPLSAQTKPIGDGTRTNNVIEDPETATACSNHLYTKTTSMTRCIYYDETGKLIPLLGQGFNCFIIVYHKDCSTIIYNTIQNKSTRLPKLFQRSTLTLASKAFNLSSNAYTITPP